MITIGESLVHRMGKMLPAVVLFFSVTTPVILDTAHAEQPPAVSARMTLKTGDLYGGGKVVEIFSAGEKGYVVGETHGFIAAVEDIGNGATWGTAVKLCKSYRAGGFSDWRLPSKEELNRMYLNKAVLGGFIEGHFYWSSTESDKNDAWDQSFRTGISNLGYKLDSNYVRAVRSF
ncbi:MAG: DUF1566 domain-containing protein [Chlorobiaceae bacterium]|nr:DUF1566 domain-containing protein [Chlorobiaceae bacterium]